MAVVGGQQLKLLSVSYTSASSGSSCSASYWLPCTHTFGKAVKDGLSAWASMPMWETWVEFPAPGFGADLANVSI